MWGWVGEADRSGREGLWCVKWEGAGSTMGGDDQGKWGCMGRGKGRQINGKGKGHGWWEGSGVRWTMEGGGMEDKRCGDETWDGRLVVE